MQVYLTLDLEQLKRVPIFKKHFDGLPHWLIVRNKYYDHSIRKRREIPVQNRCKTMIKVCRNYA